MASAEAAAEIEAQGWVHVPFEMSEADRAAYARLATQVMGLTICNPDVRTGLDFKLVEPVHDPPVNAGLFGVHGPQHSAENKVWLHAGYQSRDRAAEIIPEWRQPELLRTFWPAHEAMLRQSESSVRLALSSLGAEALNEVVFPESTGIRNFHIRTVRYIGAQAVAAGTEVVTGHADQGLAALHIFETHHGYMAAAPYPKRLIVGADSLRRRASVAALRTYGLWPMDVEPGSAVFFLGAGWHGLQDGSLPDEVQGLPACYHAGFQSPGSVASEYAGRVVGGSSDRVSVVAFAHPNVEFMQSERYQVPTVQMCRPRFEY